MNWTVVSTTRYVLFSTQSAVNFEDEENVDICCFKIQNKKCLNWYPSNIVEKLSEVPFFLSGACDEQCNIHSLCWRCFSRRATRACLLRKSPPCSAFARRSSKHLARRSYAQCIEGRFCALLRHSGLTPRAAIGTINSSTTTFVLVSRFFFVVRQSIPSALPGFARPWLVPRCVHGVYLARFFCFLFFAALTRNARRCDLLVTAHACCHMWRSFHIQRGADQDPAQH